MKVKDTKLNANMLRYTFVKWDNTCKCEILLNHQKYNNYV